MTRAIASTIAGMLAAAMSFAVAAVTTDIPPTGLPSANDFSAQLLPERAGVVSWRTLAQVAPVKQGNRMVPSFSKDILALDRQDAKVQGFMIPLDVGDKQKRFLLTAVPPHCSFCMPAGPDAMVEVIAKTPVRYSFDPIIVSGRFVVLKDDDGGLLYRLTDASQVDVIAPVQPSGAVPTGMPSAKFAPPGAK
jgi:uncharacterized protein